MWGSQGGDSRLFGPLRSKLGQFFTLYFLGSFKTRLPLQSVFLYNLPCFFFFFTRFATRKATWHSILHLFFFPFPVSVCLSVCLCTVVKGGVWTKSTIFQKQNSNRTVTEITFLLIQKSLSAFSLHFMKLDFENKATPKIWQFVNCFLSTDKIIYMHFLLQRSVYRQLPVFLHLFLVDWKTGLSNNMSFC